MADVTYPKPGTFQSNVEFVEALARQLSEMPATHRVKRFFAEVAKRQDKAYTNDRGLAEIAAAFFDRQLANPDPNAKASRLSPDTIIIEDFIKAMSKEEQLAAATLAGNPAEQTVVSKRTGKATRGLAIGATVVMAGAALMRSCDAVDANASKSGTDSSYVQGTDSEGRKIISSDDFGKAVFSDGDRKAAQSASDYWSDARTNALLAGIMGLVTAAAYRLQRRNQAKREKEAIDDKDTKKLVTDMLKNFDEVLLAASAEYTKAKQSPSPAG
jgi:hypothetical protein